MGIKIDPAALLAALDDSGRGQRQHLVFAGCVLSGEAWLPLVDAWQCVLEEPPQICYFKMREAHGGRGEFAGLTPNQINAKVQRFLSVILNYRPTVLMSAIPYSEYEEAFKGRIAKKADYPYFLAYHEVMGVWLQHQYLYGPHNKRVNFVFDEQGKEGDFVQRAWDFGASQSPEYLKPFIGEKPAHQSEREFLPLQAADLIAWHARHYFLERSYGREFESPIWSALSALPRVESEMSRERLLKIADGVAASGLLFEYDLPPRQRKIFQRALAEEQAEKMKQIC
jgi:hypothetical protein